MNALRPPSPWGSNRGAVLVISLWVLAMLSTIGLGLAYRTGLQTRRVTAVNGKIQSLALCQAGIARMIFELEKEDHGFDALWDLWSNNKDVFDAYKLETGKYTISYKRPGALYDSQPVTFYGAMDEESRINVNTATKEMLERLLKSVDVSEDLAEAVMDWIDLDSNARFHGAEAYDYTSMERPYVPRNGKIQMLEELLLVKGIKPDIFQKISPLLTVYGDGKVNINTAGEKVLQIVGFPEDLVEKILRFRRGLDDEEGTPDDGIFRSLEHVTESLSTTESVSNADRFMINNLTGQLTVSSRFFRIHAKGEATGGITTRVTVVVQRFSGAQQQLPARIVYWKEE